MNQRAYRQREDDGLACYMLNDLRQVLLEEMLRHSGFLTAIEPTHEDVRLALRKFVLDAVKDHELNAE